MQSCPELINLILQLYEKEALGGLFDFAKRLYSSQDGILVIGSDPNDRYEDYESIIHFYEAAGAAGLEIKIDDIKAYREETFGWVVDRVTAKLPKGIEVPFRYTYFFNKENSVWKIVHTHISFGVSDESILE